MTLDAIVSGLVGVMGSLLGAAVAWGVLVQRVRALESGQSHLWDGLDATERRCKERDAALERAHDRTRERLDGHLDAIAQRGQQ